MSLLNKYNDIPVLAKWKALILEYGIDLENDDIINSLPNISLYKTKFRSKKPTVKNHKFIDISEDAGLVPSELLIRRDKNISLVKARFHKESPIVLCKRGDELGLQEKVTKEFIPIEVQLVKKRGYANMRLPKEINENCPIFEDFVQIVGMDRLAILAFEGCWHWISGKPCKFCDATAKRCDNKSAMPTLNNLVDFKFDENAWWEKYRKNYLAGIDYVFKYIIENEKIEPHMHFQLMSGNMPHTSKVWEICTQIAEVVNNIYPIKDMDSYINLAAPRENLEETLLMAKNKMGFNQIEFNLEVYGEDWFEKVCPGKSALAGYNNMLNALKLSSKIFGFGKARSNFVLGAQPTEILLDGIKEIAKYGIVADYSVFVPKPGTEWEDKEQLSMDEVVSFTKELVKIYKENKFSSIYCGLSSRSNILYEMLNY